MSLNEKQLELNCWHSCRMCLYRILVKPVIGEEEEEGSQSSDEEGDDTPLNEDDYFEAPPTVHSTDISFTDMNLSRPLLKVCCDF